jgi:hypothetical protein
MAPTATTATKGQVSTGSSLPVSDFRAALDETLAAADADERIGPLIGATNLRLRLEFTDSDLGLNIAAAEGVHSLVWSFGEPDWTPKLLLRMAAAVANRYLLGRESLAIAIAHGRSGCRAGHGSRCSTCPRLACSASPTARWSRPATRRSRLTFDVRRHSA